jgi:hypothetical protein
MRKEGMVGFDWWVILMENAKITISTQLLHNSKAQLGCE